MVFNGSVTTTPIADPIRIGDAAGGDLTGTYPNPTILNGIITRSKIATGAVGSNELAAASVLGSILADCVVSGNKICANAIAEGHLGSGVITNDHISLSAGIQIEKLEANVLVNTTGNQTISGVKKWHRARTAGNPQLWFDVSNKRYVDETIASGTGVDLSSNQTVSGTKTFYRPKGAGDPINPEDLATKNYVDSGVGSGPPSGAAGGDLAGTYPNPTIVNGYIDLSSVQVISGNKTFHRPKGIGNPIDDKDLATKEYVDDTAGPPSGAAGGDLAGTYPNPTIALSAVSGGKLADGAVLQSHVNNGYVDLSSVQSISGNKTFHRPKGAGNPIDPEDLATKNYVDSGVGGGTPSGPAGGDLTGTYPNPTIVNGYVDLSSVQTISGNKTFNRPKAAGNPIDPEDLATKNYVDSGVGSGPPSGPAGGDLTGTYPNPTIANGYVDLSSNQTVSGTKTFHRPKGAGNPIDDKDLATKEYVDSGVGSGPPSGPAGGDLEGTYPDPTIVNGYVDLSSNQTVSGTKTFHRPKAAGNPIDDKDLTTKEYVDASGGSTDLVSIRYSTTTGQVIESGGGGEAIDFDTQDWDTHSAVVTGSSWRFICPADKEGKYTAHILINFADDSDWDSGEQAKLELFLNGTREALLDLKEMQSSPAAFHMFLNGSIPVQLTSGDYLTAKVYHTAVGDVSLSTGANSTMFALQQSSQD